MRAVHKFGSGLVLAMCLFTSASFGQANAIDIKAPVCKIISLPYLLGEIALNLGTQNAIDKVMPCLLKLWEEQIPNAQNADNQLSSSFLFVMEENPSVFFSAMAQQPKVFSDWLSELSKLSFVSGDSRPCDLETKRRQLTELLKRTHFTQREEQEPANSVARRLSEIPNHKECD